MILDVDLFRRLRIIFGGLTTLVGMQMELCAQVTNSQHPRFHAFYAVATSYAGTIGNLLGRIISSVGFMWVRIDSYSLPAIRLCTRKM